MAKIMVNELPALNDIVRNYGQAEMTLKPDGSPVTKLDLALSAHIESLMVKYFSGMTFYSEEKFNEWKFPLLALDPLDGTREYIKGRPEWALSIGTFGSEKFQGEGVVYNPMTKELFITPKKLLFQFKATFSGEVSHSESESGLYKQIDSKKIELRPMGSIAYKLGRLAYGKSDFVVSLRPKNIWDIAGGTILCKEAGLKFYSEGKEVSEVKKHYGPPLIWCHEELFSELWEIFRPKDKYL